MFLWNGLHTAYQQIVGLFLQKFRQHRCSRLFVTNKQDHNKQMMVAFDHNRG